MESLRIYGIEPFNVAVIHGGPGAPGEMEPVAQELSHLVGVLEPLQTEKTLEGQVKELKSIIEYFGNVPVTMIGFSWGAMLSFILSAKYPLLVKKLILIGSAPFEEAYAMSIMTTRLDRLSEKDRIEALLITEALKHSTTDDKDVLLMKLSTLMLKADSYDPLLHKTDIMEYQYNVYQSVWEEASRLRREGKLRELGWNIQCPVVAIHGDYDPHPYLGIEILYRILKNFCLIKLEKCGHRPWIERNVRTNFYNILRNEVL
ncbi:alpha/beta fold hydrolase [Chloroflexota bacterium]